VAAAWDRAAGESLGALARPVSLRGGVLTVEVEGAVLLQELRGFRSRELLEALRREEGGTGVRTIRWVPAGRP
jgi:predicted nucleic acid-binding Zn ribbon protein